MDSWKELPLDKEVYLFEVDDVLIPKRDYLIQVYYLFGSFVEYGEGDKKALEIAEYMKACYEQEGEQAVLGHTIAHFGLSDQYLQNYERLKANAQLPLKLLLLEDVASAMLRLFEAGKKIAILTAGNPVEQLNKIKFIEWGILDGYKHSIAVYFVDELRFRNLDSITYIADNLKVDPASLVWVNEI